MTTNDAVPCVKSMKRLSAPGLCIAFLLVWILPAVAQTDLKSLTDDALIEQLHRSEYKEEFDRRMDEASPEERTELARKRAKQPRQREFPADYTDDELIEEMARMGATAAFGNALEELSARYADADRQKVAVMEGKLRAAFAVSDYPEGTANNLDNPVYHQASRRTIGLSTAVATCLPEDRALAVLWDVHIAPRPMGGIGRFLSRLSGAPFTGQATVDRLMALRHILKTEYTTREAYGAAGESEWIGTELISLLPQCGQPGFEALKSIGWDSPAGIQAMGYVGTEESRRLLFALYEKTDPTHLEDCIQIISALASNLGGTPDPALREFVRTELTEVLLGNHFDRLPQVDMAVQVAGNTGDPYFIEPLRQLDNELTPARIPAPSATLDPEVSDTIREANEMNYRAIKTYLEKSTTKLEKARAKSE